MKITITTEVLQKQGLSLQDFGILLYYIGGGRSDIHPEISSKLWNMNLLIKEVDGYSFIPQRWQDIEGWMADSNSTPREVDRFIVLANKLREIYPAGIKEGTRYSWRDNTVTIAKKLKTLCDKCQVSFTDEEAVNATKRYVEGFNGNYAYMQLLKYFILKNDTTKMELNSQLLSYMQNTEESRITNFDSGELV